MASFGDPSPWRGAPMRRSRRGRRPSSRPPCRTEMGGPPRANDPHVRAARGRDRFRQCTSSVVGQCICGRLPDLLLTPVGLRGVRERPFLPSFSTTGSAGGAHLAPRRGGESAAERRAAGSFGGRCTCRNSRPRGANSARQFWRLIAGQSMSNEAAARQTWGTRAIIVAAVCGVPQAPAEIWHRPS